MSEVKVEQRHRLLACAALDATLKPSASVLAQALADAEAYGVAFGRELERAESDELRRKLRRAEADLSQMLNAVDHD